MSRRLRIAFAVTLAVVGLSAVAEPIGKEALDQCRAGDTLVLFDPESVDPDEVITRLPRGVTPRDRSMIVIFCDFAARRAQGAESV